MQADFEFFKRYVARKTDDYLFELDEYRRPTDDATMIIVHFRVNRWAPSVLKRMKREWSIFRTVYKDDLYASPAYDQPKWHKMVRAFGFKLLTHVRCLDGRLRPMYLNRISDGHQLTNHQPEHNSEYERYLNDRSGLGSAG